MRNDEGNANHWLEVLLIGTKSNRDGTGTVLKLTSEGFVQVKQAEGGTSYMSASDCGFILAWASEAKSSRS